VQFLALVVPYGEHGERRRDIVVVSLSRSSAVMEVKKRSRSGESVQIKEIMSRASDVCTASGSKRPGDAELSGVVGIGLDGELNGRVVPR
jgi:hypothetical protein